jgi:FAD/FMN-containing dehydrogenase
MINATALGTVMGGISPQLVEAFASNINGQVLGPRDLGYHESRRIWNGMIDRYPAVIVRVSDEVDVQRTIAFAQEQNLVLSVKGGGHNVAGYAVADGGVMLDMGDMNAVQVDPVTRTARVQGGALWRDVDAATAVHGLATVGGVIPSTGVGGLTLGGGIGWLVGKYGMTIDNLLSATVVTANGDVVTASGASHPDLFWAIRGGGGNFGVVTSFEFKLHPVQTVLAGMVAYPVSEAPDVLAFYREFAEQAPDDLTPYAQISTEPESRMRVVAIAAFWPGDLDEGERIIAPLRSFGTPIVDAFEPMPYVNWQLAFEEEFPHGRHYYWKGSLLQSIDDRILELVAEYGASSPLESSVVVIEGYRGAMNRVDSAATAFAHRNAHYQLVASAITDDPAEDFIAKEWARSIHTEAAPFSLNGGFLNFNSDDRDERTAARVRAGYGSNWERLAQIKRRYDPNNVFSQNNNIPPA